MLVMRFLPLLCPSLLSCLSNGILKWTSVTLKSFLRILLNLLPRASALPSPPNLRSQGRYPGTSGRAPGPEDQGPPVLGPVGGRRTRVRLGKDTLMSRAGVEPAPYELQSYAL